MIKACKRICVISVSLLMVLQSMEPATNALAATMNAEREANVQPYAAGNSASDTATSDNASKGEDENNGSNKTEAGTSATGGTSTDSSNAAGDDAGTGDSNNEAESTSQSDASDDNTAGEQASQSEDESQDEAATAEQADNSSCAFDTVDELKNALESGGTAGPTASDIQVTDSEVKSFTAENVAKALVILSNADPSLYRNAQIKAKYTGSPVDLTRSQAIGPGTAAKVYSFNGLGGNDRDSAFAGSLKNDNGSKLSVITNRPVFNGLTPWKDMELEIGWASTADQDAVLAANVYAGDDSKASITLNGRGGTEGNTKLSAPLVGAVNGNFELNATFPDSTNAITAIDIKTADKNAGLVARQVNSGVLKVGKISGLDKIKSLSIQTTGAASARDNDNAGFLVGYVASGAGVEISSDITAPEGTISCPMSGEECGAGGLVGQTEDKAGEKCPLTINGAVDVSNLTIQGKMVGSLIGRAGNVSLQFGNKGSVAPAVKLGTKDNTRAAGLLFGQANFKDEEDAVSLTSANLRLNDKGYTLGGSYVGGIVGIMGPGNGVLSVAGKADSHLGLKITASGNALGQGDGIGGVVGSMAWDTNKARLKVSCLDVEMTSTESGNLNVGGIVGNCWGSSFVSVNDVVVDATLNDSEYFGGLVAKTRTDYRDVCVAAIAKNIKVKAASKNKNGTIERGGGVVGCATGKTVVKLQGTTDLSEVAYDDALENTDLGQIAGQAQSQDNDGLIVFSDGTGSDGEWTLIRGKNKDRNHPELDDMASHGEVLRLTGDLKDLVQIDAENGTVSFTGEKKSGLEINSRSDFVRAAITWQTGGLFQATQEDASTLQKGAIKINSNIDLSGTGVLGLTREGFGTESFSGSIDGNGKTIKMAIGEPYGKWDENTDVKDNDAGNGRIYRHQRLGLFSSCNGSVSKLTVGGSINAKVLTDGMTVGSLGAFCTEGNVTLDELTVKPAINIEQNSEKTGYKSYIGGIYGQVTTNGAIELTGGTTCSATINAPNVVNKKTYIGGAIGFISGDATTTVAAIDAKLAGAVTAKTSNEKLYAGGFIGFIDQAANENSRQKAVNISKLDMGGLKCDFSAGGDKSAVGGLLGSSWAQTNVTIGSDAASGASYALKASGASSLTTGSAKYVGGLVYHAGGTWTIKNNAVNFSNVSIESKASALGLFVCRGGRGEEESPSKKLNVCGLYFDVPEYWEKAVSYRGINLEGTEPSTFDEWVADTRGYTASNEGDIFASGKNGIISLTTKNGSVNMDDSGSRNTYENQTDWGKKHQSNGASRYYYNLDKVLADINAHDSGNGTSGDSSSASSENPYNIDTPQEFLIWSVRHYADAALTNIFQKGDTSRDRIIGTLDMKGYSYYPIDIANTDVSITNATIVFYNKQIESLEKTGGSNKLTSANSQHSAMHCGVFRNFTSSGSQGGKSLKISNLTLQGTVGSQKNGDSDACSGALIFGSINGEASAQTTVTIDGLNLNGITVTDFNGSSSYSPLLINGGKSYFTLSVNDLSCKYGSGTVAASSLMGAMGGESETGLNIGFTDISIPTYGDKKVFTKAALLKSFGYRNGGTGSATYNFTKDAAKVTYGREIDGTKEYWTNGSAADDDAQCWYFDADHTDDNLVKDATNNTTASNNKDKPNFGKTDSPYLSYVAYGYDNKTAPWRHEIAVNHCVTQVIKGCGTYGDPYRISSAKNLRDVVSLINGGGGSGSQINLVLNQDDVCTGSNNNHAMFTKNGTSWSHDDSTVKDETVRRYLLSAYYKIDKSFAIDTEKFAGLGTTEEWAFRGVIVGSEGTTLTIKNSTSAGNGFKGLIGYSYGSVVKDLSIKYDGTALSMAYAAPKYRIPQSFFGGVIGCILGGDNIIDGVKITSGNGFGVSGASDLVAVGGYVGVVAGGGVIFRNASGVAGALNAWHEKGSSYYDNAYLGRMLDGYAFSEGWSVDNGDRNYKINEISDTANPSDAQCISSTVGFNSQYKEGNATTGGTIYPMKTQVESAKGLLILSGIINSAAASGASSYSDTRMGTKPYYGKQKDEDSYHLGNAQYGKVRNASYSKIGDVADRDDVDWQTAKKDDQNAPGASMRIADPGFDGDDVNSPYLVATYANKQTGYICSEDIPFVEFVFDGGVNGEYDMSDYGTGYLGLSGRYMTNASLRPNKDSKETAPENSTGKIIPSVGAVKGAENAVANIKVSLDVKEYSNDDYHLLGVGGLFNIANFRSPGKSGSGYKVDADSYEIISNLTMSGKIAYSFLTNKVLNDVTLDVDDAVNKRLRSIVGVGGVAGILAPSDINYRGGQTVSYEAQDLTVESPGAGGSIFGQAGYANLNEETETKESDSTAGGIRYFAKAEGSSDLKSMTMRLKGCSYASLNITADRDAGGFFGFLVSKNNSGYLASKNILLGQDSVIKSNGKTLNQGWGPNDTAAGGLVGHAKGSFCINNNDWGETVGGLTVAGVSVENKNENGKSESSSGGLIGQYEAISTCKIRNLTIVSTAETKTSVSGYCNIGGLIGRIPSQGVKNVRVDETAVDGVSLTASSTSNGYVGGIIGNCYMFFNEKNPGVTVNNSKIQNLSVDASNAGGIAGYGIGNFVIQNTAFINNTWNGNTSGALIGYQDSILTGTNILIRNNVFGSKGRQGLVSGAAYTVHACSVRIAGLDVQLGEGQVSGDLPSSIAPGTESSSNKSFVAFADYTDKAKANATGDYPSSVTENAFGTTPAVPYVTTTPKNNLTVETADGNKSLFGDSALPTTAKEIQNKKGSATEGRYEYSLAPDTDLSSAVAKMSDNNSGVEKANDFDVLQVSSGSEGVIDDYLDTVTNGGYSKAKALGLVTASVTPYAYSNDGNKKLTANSSTVKKALDVSGSGTADLKYSVTSGYDNDLMRVSLLTVSISSKSDASEKYVLHVPIVVRRMLEVNFTATFADGTTFTDAAYENLGAGGHVLESFGSPMTGKLTYTYNMAVNDKTEYGWDSYLADGGAMTAANKDLVFDSQSGQSGRYPAGTQLTLVDCAHNNKQYHYTVPAGDAIGSLSLSEFEDSSGNHYAPVWLSELMDVTAVKEDDGTWVECKKEDAKASGKVDGATTYFRPKTSKDVEDKQPTYKLTVKKTGSAGSQQEDSPSEDFFLVVRCPEDKSLKASAVIGSMQSKLRLPVAVRVNQTLRPKQDGKTVVDGQSNTASTYSILAGYSQELRDNDVETTKTIPAVTSNGHTIKLDVTDTIKFNTQQPYGDNDPLYCEFKSSLAQWTRKDGAADGALSSSGGFPAGTTGEVTFVATVGDTVYRWDGSKWVSPSDAGYSGLGDLCYDWSSDGGEMKLPVGTAPTGAVSLASLRKAAKNEGLNSFDIHATMSVNLTDEAYMKGISASPDGADAWTTQIFRSVLATTVDSLEYSNMIKRINGNHPYYRDDTPFSTISLVASKPSQLGINIDDLRQDTANGTIGTSATYDLSKATNAASLIDSASKVEFTATLQRRVTDASGNETYVPDDITNVMSSVSTSSSLKTVKGSGQYSWTDEKGTGDFATRQGQSFVLPIDFKVDTARDKHTYANYRIFITAKMYNAKGEVINEPGNGNDFVTFTLTRVNLKGI